MTYSRGPPPARRVETCWQPGEPRGRSAVPRRRPTYYTVTVPTSVIPTIPSPGPAHRSGSDDSISDLSSISHATSPGSSSPDVSFPRPPLPPPLVEPGYYPRGAHRFLPPAGPPAFLYEQDLAPLRYQRLVPSHSRIVRTPSLKDYTPAGGRGLSKAAVTEELMSWHQRARLRGARPHSLDRQGAFRGPRGGSGSSRDVPITRGVLPWAQVGQGVRLVWGRGRVGGTAVPVPMWGSRGCCPVGDWVTRVVTLRWVQGQVALVGSHRGAQSRSGVLRGSMGKNGGSHEGPRGRTGIL